MPYLELHTTTTTGTIDWKLLRAPVLFRGIMDAYVPLFEEKGGSERRHGGDKVISLRSNYLRLSCYETIPWKATRPNRQSISFTKKRNPLFHFRKDGEKKKDWLHSIKNLRTHSFINIILMNCIVMCKRFNDCMYV